MAKKQHQNEIECPKCGYRFNRKTDILNKKCTKCEQWKPLIDFHQITENVCKICKGVKPQKFSSLIRLKTPEGELKQCRHCLAWKLEQEFSKKKDALDGLQPWCKKCNGKSRKSKEKKNG